MKKKFKKLSPALKKLIIEGDEVNTKKTVSEFTKASKKPVSDYSRRVLNHCNGGSTLQAALWLKNHLDHGGKLMVTLAGALSSFQVGIMLAELIRKNKVHLISATGANHEESYYRYVAHSHYAYIPRYTELTPEQEAELRDTGLRRITDTFLPEDESVRIMEPHLYKMWQKAQKEDKRYFPHEYFRRLFAECLIKPDPEANVNDCWTYAAYKKNIPIIIPGFEDSTMGNIFASYTYGGKHRKKGEKVINDIDLDVLQVLQMYLYPRNIKELENIIQHAHILAKGKRICLGDLPARVVQGAGSEVVTPQINRRTMGEVEKDVILEALRRNDWNRKKAAEELGINRTTLWRKMKRMGYDSAIRSVSASLPPSKIEKK